MSTVASDEPFDPATATAELLAAPVVTLPGSIARFDRIARHEARAVVRATPDDPRATHPGPAELEDRLNVPDLPKSARARAERVAPTGRGGVGPGWPEGPGPGRRWAQAGVDALNSDG